MNTPMKRRVVRVFIVLWLGWYLWGPVDPAVDWWDTPRQTMADMVRAAGGMVVLMGAGLALAFMQMRKLRDRFRRAAHAPNGVVARRADPAPPPFLGTPIRPAHSPPIPLRI